MQVNPVNNLSFAADNSAKARQKKDKDTNPVSVAGERATLATATFVGGLGVGFKLLAELWDGDFLAEKIGDKSIELVDKAKGQMSGGKQALMYTAAMLGLTALAVGVFAVVYTLFKAPNIAYNGKVNAFKKGKEMDVYIEGNEAERELYTQLNDKAKDASEEEKQALAQQYMQLSVAKNKLPDFISATKRNF